MPRARKRKEGSKVEEQIKLLMQVIQTLTAQNEQLTALVAELKITITKQAAENEALNAKISELLATIDAKSGKKNSRNSSIPPSADGYAKPAPKSLRKSSGAKPGGQPGHKGSSMKLMKEPDEYRAHYPDVCSGCPNAGLCKARVADTRHEVDIVVETKLIAHQQMVCCCQLAGNREISGSFPSHITGTKQYGHNLKAVATALYTVGMMSYDRIHQLLESVFQIPVSTGRIQKWVETLATATKDAADKIGEIITGVKVINCDETGLRVQGSLKWVHCACTDLLTYLFLHDKRGYEAMLEMGVLSQYGGTVVHDFWNPYLRFEDVLHSICCAHLQRELVYADEQMDQSWAKPLHDLLNEILHRRKQLQDQSQSAFADDEWAGYSRRYDALIAQGLNENPLPQRVTGKCGRPKKGKMRSLLERFRDYKAEILRFSTDWTVPFTNNEAELSIRFSKVKQKVSGCFRTKEGAEQYMQIMSYVSSCKKHGIGYFEAIREALNGNALELVAQWG